VLPGCAVNESVPGDKLANATDVSGVIFITNASNGSPFVEAGVY